MGVAVAAVVPSPGGVEAEAEVTRMLDGMLRDVMNRNQAQQNFRRFGPDEHASNGLDAVFEVTGKAWMAEARGRGPEPQRRGRRVGVGEQRRGRPRGGDGLRRIPRLAAQVAVATARYWATLERHKLDIGAHGDDLPQARDWRRAP